MRAAKSMPPMAVSIPIMIKQVVTIRFGFSPARRAASALPPIAYTLRPNLVLASMKPKISTQMIMTQTGIGSRKIRNVPSLLNVWFLIATGFPPQMI